MRAPSNVRAQPYNAIYKLSELCRGNVEQGSHSSRWRA